MRLLQHLSTIIDISDELKKKINSLGILIEVPKGEVFIKIDERCNSIYFIEKGLLRGYYYIEGKEITNWFAEEGEFATCFYSFVAQKPSFEFIQALEDCRLLQLSFKSLQDLYSNFPETERVGRIITENYYIKLEERVLNLQFKTAKERYNKLCASKPALLQRASLGQIASYLGITQETLSRIRGEG